MTHIRMMLATASLFLVSGAIDAARADDNRVTLYTAPLRADTFNCNAVNAPTLPALASWGWIAAGLRPRFGTGPCRGAIHQDSTAQQQLHGIGPQPKRAFPIRRSVQQDDVVCLECRYRARRLRRHLGLTHGLEVADYRTRWKLPADYPVTAPSYSAQRSTMAKQRGFGRKPGSVMARPADGRSPPQAAYRD
jgi:predicted transcriptional regulator